VVGKRLVRLQFPDKKKAIAAQPSGSSGEAQPDPAANLTFNLHLTPKQRAAQQAVVLPYMYHLNNQGQMQQGMAWPIACGVCCWRAS
jgi:hypothetical protein